MHSCYLFADESTDHLDQSGSTLLFIFILVLVFLAPWIGAGLYRKISLFATAKKIEQQARSEQKRIAEERLKEIQSKAASANKPASSRVSEKEVNDEAEDSLEQIKRRLKPIRDKHSANEAVRMEILIISSHIEFGRVRTAEQLLTALEKKLK